MIQTQNLSKHYRMGAETVCALDGVDLRIARGESVAILGPSGSGKSTLLHLLGGLDRPTSGRIAVDGVELSALDRAGLARYRNRKVGFVFQAFHLQDHLSAVENVSLPLKIRGVPKPERSRVAMAHLAEVGLSDRGGHRPTELSGGQCQRVCIARALAGDPAILLADEPTGNLDTRTGHEIMEIFLRLNRDKGLTLILVTHNPGLAELVHRCVRIVDGRIADGPA